MVVIAIISLLVSILLPSLNRAKDLAKRVICASNMHGVTMAYIQYASERNDYVPIGYRTVKQWNYLIWHQSVGASDPKKGLMMFGCLYLADLMDSPEVFYCPAASGETAIVWETYKNRWPPGSVAGAYVRAGYGCRPAGESTVVNPNADWASLYSPPNPFPRMMDFDQKAIVADILSEPSHLAERHGDGVNAGFSDGSAIWVGGSLFEDDLNLLDANWETADDPIMDNIWDTFDEQR